MVVDYLIERDKLIKVLSPNLKFASSLYKKEANIDPKTPKPQNPKTPFQLRIKELKVLTTSHIVLILLYDSLHINCFFSKVNKFRSILTFDFHQ